MERDFRISFFPSRCFPADSRGRIEERKIKKKEKKKKKRKKTERGARSARAATERRREARTNGRKTRKKNVTTPTRNKTMAALAPGGYMGLVSKHTHTHHHPITTQQGVPRSDAVQCPRSGI